MASTPAPAVTSSPAVGPDRSTSTPARALPSAAPPKIMLLLQAKASVVVPAGAASPSSTELQAENGAIVRP